MDNEREVVLGSRAVSCCQGGQFSGGFSLCSNESNRPEKFLGYFLGCESLALFIGGIIHYFLIRFWYFTSSVIFLSRFGIDLKVLVYFLIFLFLLVSYFPFIYIYLSFRTSLKMLRDSDIVVFGYSTPRHRLLFYSNMKPAFL